MEIKFKNIFKKIADKEILKNVSFSVPNGSVFALVGSNGAGKTTIGRILLGTYTATSGNVTVDGVDISNKNYDKLKEKIGFVLDNLGLFNSLTAWQNVEFFDRVYNVNDSINIRKTRIEKALKSVDLLEKKDSNPLFFSRGMKQRLAIARLLICNPQLVFLDEPSKGLDVEGKLAIRDYINKLKKDGATVFLCSHDLGELEKIATHIAFIDKGEILFCGTYEDAKKKFAENSYKVTTDKIGTWVNELKNCSFVNFVKTISKTELIVNVKNLQIDLHEWLQDHNVKIYEYKRINDDLETMYMKIFGITSSSDGGNDY